jgi:hypothetical protein
MEKTWASGALELLRHADSHLDLDSAFDKRIAFISIDSCVETCIRIFLSLPPAKSGVKVPRTELDAAANSFPKLVELLFGHVGGRLTGLDPYDFEHYHRIRNRLYHEGTGLSVDENHLVAYRSIATILLKNLFNVDVQRFRASEPPRMERLILNWNLIEETVKKRMRESGADDRGTYKWEAALQAGVLTTEAIELLNEVRMARNRIVHSTDTTPEGIRFWTDKSVRLLKLLGVESTG